MLAGGHLREHPAERGVEFDLGGHLVGYDTAPIFDHSGGGLVAGGLYRQDAHCPFGDFIELGVPFGCVGLIHGLHLYKLRVDI